jgi:hypothetical protein
VSPGGPSVKECAEQDPGDGDDERDDEPPDQRPVDALADGGAEGEDEREQQRNPPRHAGSGVAEGKARDEEEDVGDHGTADDLTGRSNVEAPIERGSQDSNLEPPVLETGTLPN